MTDLVTVYSIVAGAWNLASKSATIVKDLRDLTNKYKNAELSLLALIEECETIELAWSRIQRWCNGWADDASADKQLLERLTRSVITGNLVLSALEQDVSSLKNSGNTSRFLRRSRILWRESSFRDHQKRVNGQVNAMNLMLQVVMLPQANERASLLQSEEKLLRTCDESALSIVPSRLSSRIDVSSIQSRESSELMYRRLSFEDLLFTTNVYKRNYRHRAFSGLLHPQKQANRSRQQTERNSISRSHTSQQPEDINEKSSGRACSTYDASDIFRLYEDPPGLFQRMNNDEDVPSARTSIDHWHLNLAISQNRLDVLDSLLRDSSSDLKEWKTQALMEASRIGAVPLIEILIKRGADLRDSGYSDPELPSRGPLLEAVRQNQLGAACTPACTLLEHGASVEDICAFGMEYMHVAIGFASADLIRFLRTKGDACLTGRYSDGNSPIHMACKHGNVGAVTALLEIESQVTALNSKGLQPIHVACAEGASLTTIEVLIAHGASIEASTTDGFRPLQFAILNHNWLIVRKLLDLHVEINIGENTEAESHLGTPLSLALYTGNTCLASVLISKGANINATHRSSQKTLLHLLAADLDAKKTCFLEELLAAGGDVHAIDKRGYQPLQYIVKSNSSYRIQGARILISHGADVDARSSNGVSPLYLALEKGDKDLIELLVRYGAHKWDMGPCNQELLGVAGMDLFTASRRLAYHDVLLYVDHLPTSHVRS